MLNHFSENWFFLVPLFPLLGFIFNIFFGARAGKRTVSFVGVGTVFISFIFSLVSLFDLLSVEKAERVIINTLWTWLEVGDMKVQVAFLIDPLSQVMAVVVTGVGAVIHLYSVGYMGRDKRYSRYFAFLNLFIFCMLILCTGQNLLLLFLGWEGVGLCSYLLIGFWYEDMKNATAGVKAFIVNRIGDFGFILGIFLLFWSLGKEGLWTLNFDAMKAGVHLLPNGTILAISILLFAGACGKSAQIPLYVWLPDAMAGPTPVSALIHAATMVTAGIYMVARMNFLFSLSPLAMNIVAGIGCATLFFSATIALTQNDIKRVLAYSTISQLGYMFLGVGVGAYSAGIFHLMTHAFFKALLFLGAGSVIHSLSNIQDMRQMGGLKERMKVTYITMLIGCLTISGIPGLAGFFSKDEILFKTFTSPNGSTLLWFFACAGAGLTAFYMFRLLFLTFFGRCRAPHEVEMHIHESPKVMTIPLIILAILSIIGGYIGLPHSLGGSNRFERFLEPVFSTHEPSHAEDGKDIAPLGYHDAGHSYDEAEGGDLLLEYLLMLISTGISLTGILVAYIFYIKRPEIPERLAQRFRGLYTILLNKYYVDELYDALFVKTLHLLNALLARFDLNIIDRGVDGSALMTKGISFRSGDFDIAVVDGAVNGVADSVIVSGGTVRRIQTGYIQNYLLISLIGIVGILITLFILSGVL